MAHDVGRALGLVLPYAPGMALSGGISGAQLAHSVAPDRVKTAWFPLE